MDFFVRNIDREIASIEQSIDATVAQPSESNIKASHAKVRGFLANQDFNSMPGIRNAFNALHELDRGLNELEDVFTSGTGKITKEDLDTISGLMKKSHDAIPAAPPPKTPEEQIKSNLESESMLLFQAREAIRNHDFKGALEFTKAIPTTDTRDDRLQKLAYSMMSQRSGNVGSQFCYEIAGNISDERTRLETFKEILNTLIQDKPKDYKLINEVMSKLSFENKIAAKLLLAQQLLPKDQFQAILKDAPKPIGNEAIQLLLDKIAETRNPPENQDTKSIPVENEEMQQIRACLKYEAAPAPARDPAGADQLANADANEAAIINAVVAQLNQAPAGPLGAAVANAIAVVAQQNQAPAAAAGAIANAVVIQPNQAAAPQAGGHVQEAQAVNAVAQGFFRNLRVAPPDDERFAFEGWGDAQEPAPIHIQFDDAVADDDNGAVQDEPQGREALDERAAHHLLLQDFGVNVEEAPNENQAAAAGAGAAAADDIPDDIASVDDNVDIQPLDTPRSDDGASGTSGKEF